MGPEGKGVAVATERRELGIEVYDWANIAVNRALAGYPDARGFDFEHAELVQEAVIEYARVWQNNGCRVENGRPVEPDYGIMPTIARNIIVDKIRRAIRKKKAYSWWVSLRGEVIEEDGVLKQEETAVINQRLAIAIASLEGNEAAIIRYKLESPEVSVREIAAKLELPTTTAYRQVQRAFERVREQYEAICERSEQECSLNRRIDKVLKRGYVRTLMEDFQVVARESPIWLRPWAHLRIGTRLVGGNFIVSPIALMNYAQAILAGYQACDPVATAYADIHFVILNWGLTSKKNSELAQNAACRLVKSLRVLQKQEVEDRSFAHTVIKVLIEVNPKTNELSQLLARTVLGELNITNP